MFEKLRANFVTGSVTKLVDGLTKSREQSEDLVQELDEKISDLKVTKAKCADTINMVNKILSVSK